METLLILGSGARIYREYILRSLSTAYRLVIIQATPVSWQRDYSDTIIQLANMERETILSVVQQVARERQIAGVMTYDEGFVELTAFVAQELQLPGISTDCAQRCRDKLLMRKSFERAGIPSAASFLVSSLEEALQRAEQIGYPVILKPRSLAGSVGVVYAASPEQIVEAYTTAVAAFDERYVGAKGTLLEEYLDGPEVSVETVLSNGVVHIVAITQKQVMDLPYFEEVGHMVSALEQRPDTSALHNIVQAVHHALQIEVGVTHTEIRLTHSGPRVIEVGARLAGDLIPRLVYLATGIDLALCAASVATGKMPPIQSQWKRVAAVQFLYPEHPVHVCSLAVDPAYQDVEWLDQITWKAQAGDTLYLPPRQFLSRLGFIIVSGVTAAECQLHLQQARQFMRIELTSMES